MTTEITTTAEQTLIADGDTLIITDPCYILTEEDWEGYCNVAFTANPVGLDDFMRNNLGFGEVIAADTGVGDWCNTVRTKQDTEEIVIGSFAADAGMLCVVTASDLTNYGIPVDYQRLVDNDCLAVVPDYYGTVQLKRTGNGVAYLEGYPDTEKGETRTFYTEKE